MKDVHDIFFPFFMELRRGRINRHLFDLAMSELDHMNLEPSDRSEELALYAIPFKIYAYSTKLRYNDEYDEFRKDAAPMIELERMAQNAYEKIFNRGIR
jgi:hypothetical protein